MASQGRGEIKQLDRNKWLVRASRSIDGVRRTKSKTVHGTKRQAKAILTKLLAELDAGTASYASNMAFQEYFTRWRAESLALRVTARTAAGYADAAKLYLLPELGQVQLAKITHNRIQRLYNELTSAGYAPATVRYVHAVLSSSLNDAVRQGLLQSSPAANVSLPRRDTRKKQKAMTIQELQRFLAASVTSKHHVLYSLLAETGMRPGEAFGLTWNHISFDDKIVVVDQSVSVDQAGQPIVKSTKSGNTRRISIGSKLVSLLREQQASVSHLPNPMNLVFPRIDGTPIYPKNFSKTDFKDTLRRAGLSTAFRLYDLRHTAATLLLALNVHPKVVSERKGHASITLTLDTYSHVIPHLDREAGDALAGALYPEENDSDA